MTYYRHHLKTITGSVIQSYRNYPRWDVIAADIAEHCDCAPEEVEEIETAGGDFIAVDGDPVATLEHYASDFIQPPAPVLMPVFLMAAE